jgi:HD-GYP domain-containing protein (c-di-GMP phosphodiesterase class II)
MKIIMNKLISVFSHALDTIEEEQTGVSEHHGMRIAALCVAIGKRLGYNNDSLTALCACALFHDNALTEYRLSENDGTQRKSNMVLHCEKGQSNVSWLPFRKNIDGFILYHHEDGNGNGPFRKREGEFPFEAALISAADTADAIHHLQRVTQGELGALREKIAGNAENYSTRTAVAAMLETLDSDTLESLRDENIFTTLERSCPYWEEDLNDQNVINAASFMAHVIDYKSKFTYKHTTQIANRACLMSEFYGKDREEQAALFFAASLHDIGKIATPIGILEKPGSLDKDELLIMTQHVRQTYDWLNEIPNIELIRNWAADHHEKLDGSGYSFGRHEPELDFNSRLMACVDIYQAASEERPYHKARSHAETMPILKNMADHGSLDGKIVKDIDEVMAEYSMRDVPSPYK